MDKPEVKPYVPEELVDYLERIFPNRCPSITDSDRQVWVSVGKQDVVKHLRSLHNAQTKARLEGG